MTLPLLPKVTRESELDFDISRLVGRALVTLPSLSEKAVSNLLSIVDNQFDELDLVIDLTNVTESASTEELVDLCIKLLDAGALSLVVTIDLAEKLYQVGVTDSRRLLILSDLSSFSLESITSKDIVSGVIFKPSSSNELVKVAEIAKAASNLVLPQVGGNFAVFAETTDYQKITPAIPIISTDTLTVSEEDTDKISLAKVLLRDANTDRPDGLFATIVIDHLTEQSLGLVYSSPESVAVSLARRRGVYQSRKRGLWFKGESSGAVQKLKKIEWDCDSDCLKFVVSQEGAGFCHLNTQTCFGVYNGIPALEKTLQSRIVDAPVGSYTARLFKDRKLLTAKIMEEAEELCEAKTAKEVSWEAADLIYFASVKLIQEGVSWKQVQRNLDLKARKISRRKGDAKPKWIAKESEKSEKVEKANPITNEQTSDLIHMSVIDATNESDKVEAALKRPAQRTSEILKLVQPIVERVRNEGDKALLELTEKFDKVKLDSPVIEAPFDEKLLQLPNEVKAAIDLSIANVEKFHSAQLAKPNGGTGGENTYTLRVETSPGVVCSRFSRPIESVGLYVPGGTAVLPSTALMLGVPAKVAGCKNIILASPPRPDGTVTPEIVYVASKIGASKIVLAGGAQAVAALSYGTASVPKVDKILGPGNQFVTAAKMYVQNDTSALVSIDMPAGPSEVLVIADSKANPRFVASDLLSQAEHGVDSQVILVAAGLSDKEIDAIQDELHTQAMALPRTDIIRKSIGHSTILRTDTVENAIKLSNRYAPEHLILQVENASSYVPLVDHAGSVFVGAWSPESCGDYSSGTNHTLPTYGYARMYSGVNTQTFQKHLTSQELTKEGLKNIGNAVMTLAATEGLDAHRMAVKVRLDSF